MKMRALPEQQLEVVQQHAMALQSDELTQLMASWARFIALLLAEVNHAMVESKKKQALNREQWTLPDKKKDGDKDEGPRGNPEGGHGDLTSMMQGNKPTLVFTQMRRLRQGMELLPPTKTSECRSFLLLQRLRASGHYRHGMRVLEPYLRAVEQLLQSFAECPEVAVEDVDVA